MPGAADNPTGCLAVVTVAAASIAFYKVAAGGASSGAPWTAAGTKTIPPFTFSYLLN
jgi:hypothetical protein